MDGRLVYIHDNTHSWIEDPNHKYDNEYIGKINPIGVFITSAHYICSECGTRKKVKWVPTPAEYLLPYKYMFDNADNIKLTCGEIMMKAVLE